ncbi:MAG TPA: hypothetical protein ENN58_00005, partial [bacterium]|nr:hypothetical protein [bacterium]
MELAFSAEFKTELIFVEKTTDVLKHLPKESFLIVDSCFENSSWLENFENVFVFEGELQKDFQHFEVAVEWLTNMKADRNSVVAGIGGGAVTDFAGFLASVFNRGTRLILVPTTVLSATDSAIGGKTGLNYVAKNILGSFYPAEKVVVATEFFESLSNDMILSGKVEMIKVAMLRGGKLAELVEQGKSLVKRECMEEAIKDKYFFVRNDLTDRKGTRMYLNWGHTFGHAIERCYGIPHGMAVATGMILVQKYMKNMISEVYDPDMLKELFRIHGIELDSGLYLEKKKWLEFIKYDKKREKKEISMVYLKKKGYPDKIKRSIE